MVQLSEPPLLLVEHPLAALFVGQKQAMIRYAIKTLCDEELAKDLVADVWANIVAVYNRGRLVMDENKGSAKTFLFSGIP